MEENENSKTLKIYSKQAKYILEKNYELSVENLCTCQLEKIISLLDVIRVSLKKENETNHQNSKNFLSEF